jgi:CHASE3 domain sensor protein
MNVTLKRWLKRIALGFAGLIVLLLLIVGAVLDVFPSVDRPTRSAGLRQTPRT